MYNHRWVMKMEDGVSLLEIFKVAVKNFKMILGIIIICCLSGFALSFTSEVKYSAKGSVFVMYNTNRDATTNTSLVTMVNSFIPRDFIIKPVIEELELEITIEEFLTVYSLTSEVDNGFINLKCTAASVENNIRIVNEVIDTLVDYAINVIGLDAVVMPTEYASYNLEVQDSKWMYLAVSLLTGCTIAGCVLLYKLFFSPYVQSEEELKRIAQNAKIPYYNIKKLESLEIYNKIEDKRVVVLDTPPNELINKLKQKYTTNALFLDLENALSIDLEKAKEDFKWIFIVTKGRDYLGMEVDEVIEFIRIEKVKKKEILDFTAKEEKRLLIGV